MNMAVILGVGIALLINPVLVTAICPDPGPMFCNCSSLGPEWIAVTDNCFGGGCMIKVDDSKATFTEALYACEQQNAMGSQLIRWSSTSCFSDIETWLICENDSGKDHTVQWWTAGGIDIENVAKPGKVGIVPGKSFDNVYENGTVDNVVVKIESSGNGHVLKYSKRPPAAKQCYICMAYCGPVYIARRFDGSVPFQDMLWADYQTGFGNPPNGEFFIGLDNLHKILQNGLYKLRIELTPWEDEYEMRYAEYGTFMVADSSDNYTLTIGGYSGTAGDSMAESSNEGWQQWTFNGQPFSTIDRDNDNYSSSCVQYFSGANWWNRCGASNLFGTYSNTSRCYSEDKCIVWLYWPGAPASFRTDGGFYSFKQIEMLIIPI